MRTDGGSFVRKINDILRRREGQGPPYLVWSIGVLGHFFHHSVCVGFGGSFHDLREVGL